MSLFDTLRCDYPLPDSGVQRWTFHTQDLRCLMDRYRLDADGRLTRRHPKLYNPQRKPARPAPEPEDVGYHGDLHFHAPTRRIKGARLTDGVNVTSYGYVSNTGKPRKTGVRSGPGFGRFWNRPAACSACNPDIRGWISTTTAREPITTQAPGRSRSIPNRSSLDFPPSNGHLNKKGKNPGIKVAIKD